MALDSRRRRDLWLIFGLLVCSGIALFLVLFFRTPGGQVVVEVDGAVYGRYDLHKDATVRIETEDGSYNLLQIADGCACVTQANCPDKLCVHQPKISQTGENIVCLPHRVVVFIEEPPS